MCLEKSCLYIEDGVECSIMIKRYKLLQFNQQNKNGRVYTSESFVGGTLNKPFYPIAEYDDYPDI